MIDFDRKWSDMIEPGTPIPTPADEANRKTRGVFEGGGYMAKGVYRPFYDCTMKSAGYDNFCPVCIRSIQRIIDSHKQ